MKKSDFASTVPSLETIRFNLANVSEQFDESFDFFVQEPPLVSAQIIPNCFNFDIH